MAPPLVILKNVLLTFGGRPLFEDLSLSLLEKERIVLVGRNGSGKSTLLKVLSELVEMDRGERVVKKGASLVYLPQDPEMPSEMTIAQYVAQGLSEDRQHEAFQVERILEEMGLQGHLSLKTLSGGEKRKTTLARAFVEEPDLLLLDEPTNHLDLPTIEWLEERLKAFKGAFILISHDRMFLTHLSQTTLWLDRGQVRRLDKGFQHFEAWSEEILAQEEAENRKRDKLIEEETRWSRQGISARRKRNQGRLRRLAAFRSQKAESLKQPGLVRGLEAQTGEISSRVVLEAKKISKWFGDKPIVQDFSLRLLRGDRVGIIGPNGVGKTTLLKMLMGEIPVDSGKMRWGLHLTPTYLDQNRGVQLDPNRTLWETLCDTGADQILVRGTPRHVVGYLKDFLFEERQARSPVHVLSGGEKNRLLLAKALAKESNLIILDEPTNDLDMETLDLLQEVLDDYDGTLLLISHDRSFLDRVVTSTLVFEGEGKIVEYAGGYSDYRRLKPLEASSFSPTKTSLSSQRKKPARVEEEQKKPTSSKKLSYNQQRLLDILPQEITTLEAEKIEIEKKLSDSEMFLKNPQDFERLTKRHTQIINDLSFKENQWLELGELRDTLFS